MDDQLLYTLIFDEFSSDITRNINLRMTKFLERIPNNFAKNEKNFLVAMFLGGLYEFEYSEQNKILENNKDKIKSLYYYDQINSTLHLVFIINDKQRYLRSIMLLPDQSSNFEIPEVLMKNLDFTHRSINKIIYEVNKGWLWESPILPLKLNEASEDKEFIEKLTQHSQQKFVLVNSLSEVELHSENINKKQTALFGHNELAVVEQAVKTYINSSQKVYQSALNDMVQSLGADFVNTTLFSQGFLFGELALVHSINAYAKLSANREFAELMAAYRATPENRDPYPIFFNPHNVSASEIIHQLQALYLRVELPERGYRPQAIIANFPSQSSMLNVKSIPIAIPNQIMSKFFLETLSDEQCKENLKQLFYRNSYKKNLHNFFSQLLGFAISYYEKDCTLTKSVFLWNDEKLHNHNGILVIKKESSSIIKTHLILDFRTKLVRNELSDPMGQNVNSAMNLLIRQACADGGIIRYIRIGIDLSKDNAEEFFELVTVDNHPTFSSKLNNVINGEIISLNSIDSKQLFVPSESGNYNFNLSSLNEIVKPIRPLVRQKSYFQCLFQGVLEGLTNEENMQILFFGQTNNGQVKPIDGVVKIVEQLPNQEIKERDIFIFNTQDQKGSIIEDSHESLISNILDPIEKYIASLKKFTELENIEAVILFINQNKYYESNYLTSVSRIIKIEQVTSDQSLISFRNLCQRHAEDNFNIDILSLSNCNDIKDVFYKLSQFSYDVWTNLHEAEKQLILDLQKNGVKLETIKLFQVYSERVSWQLIEAAIDHVGQDYWLFGMQHLESKYRLKKYISFLLLYNAFDAKINVITNFDTTDINIKNYDTPINLGIEYASWIKNLENYLSNYEPTKDLGSQFKKLFEDELLQSLLLEMKMYLVNHFSNEINEAKFSNLPVLHPSEHLLFIHGSRGLSAAYFDPKTEFKIVHDRDIHYFDQNKIVIYDIKSNVSAFFTHDKSKNISLDFPQIINLNEELNDLKFTKVYFDKIFNSDGKLCDFVSARKENYEVSDQGYVITTEKKYLLIDAFGANVWFNTVDNYQFSVFETRLHDYFDDIYNQKNYFQNKKENFFLKDTSGFKINLIKSINSSVDIAAISDEWDKIDKQENLPVDLFTILYSDEANKVTTHVFGSARHSIFTATTDGDYYFKAIGPSNCFKVYPPNLSEVISPLVVVQNIYIDNESKLMIENENEEDNLLDLSGFKSLLCVEKLSVLESDNKGVTHLQLQYAINNGNSLLELNIYVKNFKLLKIILEGYFYKLYMLGPAPQTTILLNNVRIFEFMPNSVAIYPQDMFLDILKVSIYDQMQNLDPQFRESVSDEELKMEKFISKIILQDNSKTHIQDIYIRDAAQLFSSESQTLLDLSHFNGMKLLLAPSIIDNMEGRSHLQYKYRSGWRQNTTGELNIYLENTNYLKIELGDKLYVFDASKSGLQVTIKPPQEPHPSALQSLTAWFELPGWPSIPYGLGALALGGVAIGITKGWFSSPYRQIPQTDGVKPILATAIAIEGLNQVGAIVRDFAQNAIYPIIDIKPATIIQSKPMHSNNAGKILQIENHASAKSIHTTDSTFQVDKPTFDLIRVVTQFFDSGFNKRINMLNKKMQEASANDAYGNSVIQDHEYHLERMHQLGIS